MSAPRLLAISPGRPGPWVEELAELRAAGVEELLLRLVEAPEALEEVLERAPTGLRLRVRPFREEDRRLARSRGLPLHAPGAASCSCHDAAGLQAAQGDFALLSPIFPPSSKPADARRPLGIPGLAALASVAPLPVLALGGVGPDRVAACRRAGAFGVAGIGAFFADGRLRRDGARAMVEASRAAG